MKQWPVALNRHSIARRTYTRRRLPQALRGNLAEMAMGAGHSSGANLSFTRIRMNQKQRIQPSAVQTFSVIEATDSKAGISTMQKLDL